MSASRTRVLAICLGVAFVPASASAGAADAARVMAEMAKRLQTLQEQMRSQPSAVANQNAAPQLGAMLSSLQQQLDQARAQASNPSATPAQRVEASQQAQQMQAMLQQLQAMQQQASSGVDGSAISIAAAMYGMNCPRAGNVIVQVAAACNGRPVCQYRVDVTQLGDPSYGCAKAFNVSWRCAGSPQLRHAALAPEASGKVVTLQCGGAGGSLATQMQRLAQLQQQMAAMSAKMHATSLAAIAAIGAPPIRVVSGTYGGSCWRRSGNATGDLARSCNGKTVCVYRVDHRILGDPAPGCAKDYVARWWCRGQIRTSRTPGEASGKTMTLSCQ